MKTLSELGVHARVEDKNITYFYGDQKRGKRGDKLGQKFDKPGLEKAFRRNDMVFETYGDVRPLVREKIAEIKTSPGTIDKAAAVLEEKSRGAFSSCKKDFSAFTKVPRREWSKEYPHEIELKNSFVPVGDMQYARMKSIPQYCESNKIPLSKREDGRLVLKGRDHVVIDEYRWTNTKNRTQGSLIEFVAAYRETTFAKAIAEISGNSRILFLEKSLGEVKRPFTSFRVPKEDRADSSVAAKKVSSLLTSHGVSDNVTTPLLRSGQAHVTKEGKVLLFGKGEDSGALEFTEKEPGKWSSTKKGEFQKPFFSRKTSGREVTVFLDPFVFLRRAGRGVFTSPQDYAGVLCLMEPNIKMMDLFFAENSNAHRFKIATFGETPRHAEIDFFNLLKGRYQGSDIELDFTTRSLGRGLEPELEIPFH